MLNAQFDDWQKVTAPKIDAAWSLHELLPELDFFVSLASVTGVTGHAGQSIYGGTTVSAKKKYIPPSTDMSMEFEC